MVNPLPHVLTLCPTFLRKQETIYKDCNGRGVVFKVGTPHGHKGADRLMTSTICDLCDYNKQQIDPVMQPRHVFTCSRVDFK